MCESLPPFGECGFGQCVNSSCICDQGFTQNLEFFYGDLPVEKVTFCDYNATAMTVLASSILVLTVLYLYLQVRVLETLTQWKRISPTLLGYSLLLASLVWRLVLVEDHLFGFDVGYSFLFVFSMFFLLVQQVVYLNKFVLYAMNVFRFAKRTKRIAELVVKLQYVLAALVFVGTMLIWATSWVNSQETSLRMMQAANVIFICTHAGFIASGCTLFSKYIADLRVIVSSAAKQWDSAFIRKCKRNIPRMRIVREAIGVSNSWSIALNLLALIFPGWLKLWVYLLYVNILTFQVSGLFVIQAAGRASCCGKNPAPPTDEFASSTVITLTPTLEPTSRTGTEDAEAL